MLDNGFEPEYSLLVQQQLVELKAHSPQVALSANIRDLRYLLWSSIDNDTSRDLDQAEVAERLPNGETKVLVGIADVDSFVPKGSAIDEHAAKETTTVYTGVRNFSMLPEQLSTGTSSLLENEDKLSIVIEFVVGQQFLPVLRVPHLRGLVRTGGGEALAIGAEGHTVNIVRVAASKRSTAPARTR